MLFSPIFNHSYLFFFFISKLFIPLTNDFPWLLLHHLCYFLLLFLFLILLILFFIHSVVIRHWLYPFLRLVNINFYSFSSNFLPITSHELIPLNLPFVLQLRIVGATVFIFLLFFIIFLQKYMCIHLHKKITIWKLRRIRSEWIGLRT